MSHVHAAHEWILVGRALRNAVAVFRNADDPLRRAAVRTETPANVARKTRCLCGFRAAVADRAGRPLARAGLVRGLH